MAIKGWQIAGENVQRDADGNPINVNNAVVVGPQSPQDMAAALRGQPVVPPTPQQQPYFAQQPNNIGAQLIQQANATPITGPGGGWQFMGKMAQAAAGHHLQAKERGQEEERHRHAADWIGKRMGAEWGQMYAMGDASQRAAIATAARDHISKVTAEARELQTTKEGAALLQGVTNAREYEDRLIGSNKAAFIQKGIDAKLKRLEAEAGPEWEVQYKDGAIVKRHKRTNEIVVEEPKLPGRGTQQPSANVQQVGPDGKPVPPKPRTDVDHPDHVDAWQSATTPSEKKMMQEHALKAHDETRKNIVANADSAKRTMHVVNQVRAALDSGATTGAGADTLMVAKKIGNALGLQFGDNVSAMEIIKASANELAKGARAGFPGPVSNFEMQTYLASVASLGNTREANYAMLDGLERIARRQADTQQAAQQWITGKQKAGQVAILAEGFDSYLSARHEAKPLYTLAEVDKMSAKGPASVAKGVKQSGGTREQALQQQRSQQVDGVPSGAVEHLRANPNLAAAFDEKYKSPGLAARLLKQAAPQQEQPAQDFGFPQ